jgi:hypothetical protein
MYGISDANKKKYTSIVQSKRTLQQQLCNNYIKNQIGVNSGTVDNWHVTGCTGSFGASPAAACENMRNNGIQGIGNPAVLAIISTIVGIIGVIVSWFQQKPDNNLINAGAMGAGDFPGSGGSGGSGGSDDPGVSLSSNWLIYAVVGVAVLFGISKKKKQKVIHIHHNGR